MLVKDNITNKVIVKKTKYFVIFIFYVLYSLIYGIKLNKYQLYFYVLQNNLLHCLTFLKYNSISNFNSLVDIVVVDYISRPNYRFEITYIFWNLVYELRVGIKLFTCISKYVYSITNFYNSAIWLEREAWDMFGIKFLFHYGLKRILTDYGFKGYPLRKDFPLIGFTDVFYNDSIQLIQYNPIELSQCLRFFRFENPWNKWYI